MAWNLLLRCAPVQASHLDSAITNPTSGLAVHGDASLEAAAAFGRWEYDPAHATLQVSAQAAQYLQHAPAAGPLPYAAWCTHIVADDLPALQALLADACDTPRHVELRLLHGAGGLRWLRWTRLPQHAAAPLRIAGILTDVTATQHAATRERLGFALTQFLVGSQTLEDAVLNVLQLVCRDLGWDWGAYWAMEGGATSDPHLACTYWYPRERDLGAFSREGPPHAIVPGRGIVGTVWSTGEARWVEDIEREPLFVNPGQAQSSGLVSGYVFPVTYVDRHGVQHRPGVMEFYSSMARQPEAQLPMLATTIGALIAQTAQRLEQQATILHLAQVDGLTGLTNRSHFYHLLTERCAQAANTGTPLGLMFIDLDRFKPINDAFGHDAGNLVLREFAQRLRALAPADAVVGRLGGDEFAILMPGQDGQALRGMAQQVLHAARHPFFFEGVELTVSASVGISTYPHSGRSGPELLRSADAAMYRVKQNGRNDCEISSAALLEQQQSQLAQRLAIETGLHHALQDDSLFLVYQSIVDIAQGRIAALEALVRWRRADGTVMPPDLFIPIAEQSHLITQIGRWVVARVCRDLAAMDPAHFPDLRVHVNMAASEFANSALPSELHQQVRDHGLAPHCLSLELTEGMLMRRPDQVIPVMRALRQLGFSISLDDFGMGHSSLSLLKNLPISSMKIDRSFVRDLSHQGNDRAIVQTIVDLGRHMALEVIAEGVETASQLAILQQSGCSLLQGYLLSTPLSMPELVRRYPHGIWRQEAPRRLAEA